MSFYEHIFIARPDLTPDQVNALADKYEAVIVKDGGKVTKRENWGLRTLAYKIAKNKKGYYVLMNVDAPVAAVAELDRLMRVDEDVIRYLTVKVDALEEGPSAMLSQKNHKNYDEFEFDMNASEGEVDNG